MTKWCRGWVSSIKQSCKGGSRPVTVRLFWISMFSCAMTISWLVTMSDCSHRTMRQNMLDEVICIDLCSWRPETHGLALNCTPVKLKCLEWWPGHQLQYKWSLLFTADWPSSLKHFEMHALLNIKYKTALYKNGQRSLLIRIRTDSYQKYYRLFLQLAW